MPLTLAGRRSPLSCIAVLPHCAAAASLLILQAYTLQRLQHFAHLFARRVNPQLTSEQVDYVANEVLQATAAMQEPVAAIPQQNLRLVLRHDCL